MTLFSWRERAIASMLLLSSFLAYGPRAYAAPRDIYLAEIGWAGSFVSTADEWIEVANRSDTEIDISGWSLTGAATGGAAITFPVGSVIQPHDVFLIANYAATHTSSALNETPDLITTSVSLPNDKQLLTLLDGEGLEIDRVGDDTTPFAGDSVTRASMKRVDAHTDGGTEEAWKTAELSQGFDAGRTELGTPGIYEDLTMAIGESPIIVTPVEESVTASEPEVIPEMIPDDPVVIEPSAETIPETVPTEEVATTEPETIPETVTEPTTESEATSEVVTEPEPILEPLPVTPPTVETPTTTSQTSPSSSPTPYTPPPTPSVLQPIRVTAPLKINELVSDPVIGAKEWVELVNPTENSVTLTDWTLTEGGGASHDLSSHTIAAQGFLVIEDPAGALNNDTDTVMLIDPFGTTIDRVTYGTASIPTTKDPESLAQNSAGAWVKTETPTKGAVNVIHVTAVATQTNTSTTTSTSTSTTSSSQTVTDESDEAEPASDGETQTSSHPVVVLGTLMLSEILADPEGEEAIDEFIELFYTGTETRDAGGWMLEDKSGKRFTIPVGTTFVPGAYYSFFRTQTSIALNNTNETITLLAPDGTEADQKTYERSKEGTSLAYLDGQWLDQGEPTPNEPNRVSTPSVASDGSSAVSSSTNPSSSTTPKGGSKNPGTLHAVTLAAALTLPDNTHISLEGTVTAAPGMLGKQIAYIQMDGVAIQLYRNDGVFPAFTLGDRVKAVGVLSTIRGERRLKLNEDGLTLNGAEDLSPTKMTIKEAIEKGGGGAFIEIEATLFSKSGQKLVLEQDGAQIPAVLPDGATAPALGSRVRIRGIASASTGTLRILPRTAKDIEVVTDDPKTAGAVLSTDKPTTPSGTRIAPGMILLGITILATAGFAVRHYFSKYTYGKYPSLRFSTQKSH